MKSILIAVYLLFAGGVGQSFSPQKMERLVGRTQQAKDIVQTIADDPDFTTLTTAIKAANLSGALSQAGPFTVFAPTNEAFTKVTELPELLKAENMEKLVALLKYHVVPNKVMAEDLRDGQTITTLTGEELLVSMVNGKVLINGSEISQSNRTASNGVIHVTSTVLQPGANMGNK